MIVKTLSYTFRGFSREKDDKDCYNICFDITAHIDDIQYNRAIGSLVNKLENTGYLDGVKLQKGENYAGKRSYF